MKKVKSKLLLKIITSCLMVAVFTLHDLNIFNTAVSAVLSIIILVSFWILLDR
jgi:hypothetical protein